MRKVLVLALGLVVFAACSKNEMEDEFIGAPVKTVVVDTPPVVVPVVEEVSFSTLREALTAQAVFASEDGKQFVYKMNVHTISDNGEWDSQYDLAELAIRNTNYHGRNTNTRSNWVGTLGRTLWNRPNGNNWADGDNVLFVSSIAPQSYYNSKGAYAKKGQGCWAGYVWVKAIWTLQNNNEILITQEYYPVDSETKTIIHDELIETRTFTFSNPVIIEGRLKDNYPIRDYLYAHTPPVWYDAIYKTCDVVANDPDAFFTNNIGTYEFTSGQITTNLGASQAITKNGDITISADGAKIYYQNAMRDIITFGSIGSGFNNWSITSGNKNTVRYDPNTQAQNAHTYYFKLTSFSANTLQFEIQRGNQTLIYQYSLVSAVANDDVVDTNDAVNTPATSTTTKTVLEAGQTLLDALRGKTLLNVDASTNNFDVSMIFGDNSVAFFRRVDHDNCFDVRWTTAQYAPSTTVITENSVIFYGGFLEFILQEDGTIAYTRGREIGADGVETSYGTHIMAIVDSVDTCIN